MKLKEKALVKDLELQIDYLIGYTPQGLHWKQEYAARQNLLNEALSSEYFPEETRNKINNIQESLYKLRNKETNSQDYLNYSDDPYKTKHKVKVNDIQNNEFYTIEI